MVWQVTGHLADGYLARNEDSDCKMAVVGGVAEERTGYMAIDEAAAEMRMV